MTAAEHHGQGQQQFAEHEIQARIGASVAAVRRDRGLTQTALAASSGVTRPYLNRLEAGHRNPTVVVLVRLAHALETTVQTLVEGV